MECGSVDPEDVSEDLSGKRKSRMKSLKLRLFGKKRKEEVDRKLSQSASNIEGDVLECEEELVSPQGTLGSRALSHDSIFVPDQGSPAPEPPRVLSQENVHSNIKALQEKLQQQNMRLGPPPLVVPIKRQEDLGGSSEDDGLPHSPSDTCQGDSAPRGGSYKAFTQSSSRPLSPIAKPSPTHSTQLQSTPQSGVSPVPSTVDFSRPAEFTPCLDNSAARHRMSVKPRNQRASAKTRRLITNEPRQRSESFNTFERPVSEREEGMIISKEMTRLRSFSTQVFGAGVTGVTTSTGSAGSPLTTPEFTPLRSAPLEVLRSSSPTLHLSPRGSPQKHTLSGVSSPGPGPSQKPVQPLTGQQPQPLFAQSKPELQERKAAAGSVPPSLALAANSEGLKASGPSGSDRPSAGLSAVEALKTSLRRGSQEGSSPGEASDSASPASPASVSQEDVGRQPEAGLRKVAPGTGMGSGSFKFSITSSRVEHGRSRTGSLLGVMEPAGAGLKKEDRERGTDMRGKPSNLIGQEQRGRNQEERGQLPDPGPGDKSTVGTPKQWEDFKPGAPPQNPVTPLDRKEILRKEPFESPSPQVMDTGLMKGEEVGACHEGVEEAMEAKEEEVGKAAFGVKLRSTSLSLKYRSEAQTAEEAEPKASLMKPVSNNTAKTAGVTLKTRTGSLRQPDPAASDHPAASPKDVQITSSAASPAAEGPGHASGPKEAQSSLAAPHPEGPPTPQAPAPELSWMSFAMEKTRNLQQLFTSRLPKEFPGMQQSAPQPQGKTQSQSQAQNQAQTQAQTQAQNQAQTQSQAQPQPQSQTQKETQPQGNTSQPPITKQLPAEIRTADESSAPSQQQTGKLAQSSGPGQLKAATQTTKQPDAAKLPESVTQTAKQTAQAVTPPTSGQFSARVSQTPQQPSLRTTQPFLRSLPQTRAESISQTSPWPPLSSSPKSTPSQAPWSSRGVHTSPQTKATTPAQVSTAAPSPASFPSPASAPAPAPSPASAPGSGRVEGPGSLQRRGDGTADTDKRVMRTGALGQRTAAFQEQSSDSSPPAKVELRRIALESTTTSKTVPGAQTRPESSPTRVPGRLTEREDTCLRKNMPSCSPSSSPTSSSPLQNISNSGQPSWMELAKRKSMAWSDKTMD